MLQTNKIDHECVSVDALVEYLKRYGHQDVQVQREQEHDPPDFWLHVDGTKFAVEETSIVEQKTVTKRGLAVAKWEGEVQADLAAANPKRSVVQTLEARKEWRTTAVREQYSGSLRCLRVW